MKTFFLIVTVSLMVGCASHQIASLNEKADSCYASSPGYKEYSACIDQEVLSEAKAKSLIDSSSLKNAQFFALLLNEAVEAGIYTDEEAKTRLNDYSQSTLNKQRRNNQSVRDIGGMLGAFGAGVGAGSPAPTASQPRTRTGFLKDSSVSGLNRICVYNSAGGSYTTTIDSAQICQPTINY